MLNIDSLKCTYTNEQIVIILLSRLYFGIQEIKEVRDFVDKEPIDWHVFYRQISVNEIRGFIYDIITESQISIDQQIYDTLKKDAMANTLLVSYQSDLLLELKTEFENLGITVISYKGNTLGTRYYKSPFLRKSSDIDFLIDKNDLPMLRKCLLEKGFISKSDVSEHQMDFILNFHRELSFISPKNRIGISFSVELQWKLLNNYFGNFYQYDFFVPHLQPYIAIDGSTHVGLAPTYDFLCVASHHLIKEPLLKFKYLIDLACMVHTSAGQIDWEELNTHFKLYKYSPFLRSGIKALEDIVGLNIPLSSVPVVPYQLFAATELRSGRKFLFKKNRLVSLRLPYIRKIKHDLKVGSSLLIPNLNDLSISKGPVWSIPLIIPVKSLRFLYLYITKKR